MKSIENHFKNTFNKNKSFKKISSILNDSYSKK